MRHLLATGLAFKLEDADFDPGCNYRACLLCGAVFQSGIDREFDPSLRELLSAYEMRENWAKVHAKRHSGKEHAALKASGASMTPEAAHKLAAYGLIPLTGITEEIEVALFESSPMPTEDAEHGV